MDSKELVRALEAGTLDRNGVSDAASRAIVEFADWLAYPTELGRYPDEIEIIDSRTIYWPPARLTLPLTLLRYRLFERSGLEADQIGVGLVGSVTFSLFTYENHQRPVDDVYAMHCYWECAAQELIAVSDDVSPTALRKAIMASGIPLRNPTPVLSVTLESDGLDYPGDEVFLARGEHEGADGWLVCDGSRSTWYAASALPDDAPPATVANLHVGRVLLGLPLHAERRAFKTPPFSLPDDQFLHRYEGVLSAARAAPESERREAFASFGAVSRHAMRYVQLLTAAGRPEDVQTFVDEMACYWDHNSGYTELGKLAFEAGLFETAKHYIEKLRRSYKDHHRSETMGLLARIYAREGRRSDGVALLRDCIKKIKADEQCSPREVAYFCGPLEAALTEIEE